MPNWHQVLEEIQSAKSQLEGPEDIIRRKYLKELHQKTGRNIISYYSGFLTKPNTFGTEIDDDDKNSFMTCVHKLDHSLGLDLILHTPGGGVAEVESLIYYLKEIFGNDIRALIPQIALSAGTMMALSCKEIVMGKQSSLGPIDPHVQNLPADLVIREFNRACNEIEQDAKKAQIWMPILGKYLPAFLSNCENAMKLAREIMVRNLSDNMFADLPEPVKTAEDLVDKLISVDFSKTHNRHLHISQLKELGVKVTQLEDDDAFQDVLLTVHHCYMHSLSGSNLLKAVENHTGQGILRYIDAIR